MQLDCTIQKRKIIGVGAAFHIQTKYAIAYAQELDCEHTLKVESLHNQISMQQSSIICERPQIFETNHSRVLPQTHS